MRSIINFLIIWSAGDMDPAPFGLERMFYTRIAKFLIYYNIFKIRIFKREGMFKGGSFESRFV